MSKWQLEYGDGPVIVEFESSNELDRELDRITSLSVNETKPYLVTIFTEAGNKGPMLAIGIGRDFSVLTWYSRFKENLHVAGNKDQGRPSSWYYGNQFSELPPGFGIDNETAREAARQFVRTTQKPINVEWVE